MRRFALLAVLAVVALATFVSAQDTQTFHGTVTDSMCGRHHMMKNASDAECTRECAKEGSEFALMSGDKMFVLKGDKGRIEKWAGQSVTISGKLAGNSLTVTDIVGSSK